MSSSCVSVSPCALSLSYNEICHNGLGSP
jgi:hypothetical protein